jgi:hypothetical protein
VDERRLQLGLVVDVLNCWVFVDTLLRVLGEEGCPRA